MNASPILPAGSYSRRAAPDPPAGYTARLRASHRPWKWHNSGKMGGADYSRNCPRKEPGCPDKTGAGIFDLVQRKQRDHAVIIVADLAIVVAPRTAVPALPLLKRAVVRAYVAGLSAHCDIHPESFFMPGLQARVSKACPPVARLMADFSLSNPRCKTSGASALAPPPLRAVRIFSCDNCNTKQRKSQSLFLLFSYSYQKTFKASFVQSAHRLHTKHN